MASKGSCFYCKTESDQFLNGWKLKNGSLAQLCNKCGFAYVNGTFCETFHMESEGWRNCAICGKLLHCGCLMSCQTYAELDFGGVGCSRCLLVVDPCIASGQMTQMLKELAAKNKTYSTVPSDPTKKVFKSFSPGSLPVPSPWFRKESNTNASKGNTACETNMHSGPQVDASIGNSICAGNMQRMTSSKQHQTFSPRLNSGHIPLFDKSSITSDVNRIQDVLYRRNMHRCVILSTMNMVPTLLLGNLHQCLRRCRKRKRLSYHFLFRALDKPGFLRVPVI